MSSEKGHSNCALLIPFRGSYRTSRVTRPINAAAWLRQASPCWASVLFSVAGTLSNSNGKIRNSEKSQVEEMGKIIEKNTRRNGEEVAGFFYMISFNPHNRLCCMGAGWDSVSSSLSAVDSANDGAIGINVGLASSFHINTLPQETILIVSHSLYPKKLKTLKSSPKHPFPDS